MNQRERNPETLTIQGQEYRRVRWGDEADERGAIERSCPDCGVNKGELHIINCDQERCPRCVHGQLISCLCGDEAGE